MKKFLFPLLAAFLCACTEKIDIESRSDYHDYLAVQAILTDQADQPQQIVLSHTISFFHDEEQPMVKGASVKVNNIVFREVKDGVYMAPMGFHAEQGGDYHLKIQLADGDVYEADTRTPEAGLEIDAIDYYWNGGTEKGLDSLWTIGLWGREKEIRSEYLITHSLNGLNAPFEKSTIVGDLFFNTSELSGFPVFPIIHTEYRRKLYGDCYKDLETGDVLTLEIWTLDAGFSKYLTAINLGAVSIPLFSPQPANTPTNIRGEHVLGYFAACAVSRASVVVDDPLRTHYKLAEPDGLTPQ